MYHPYTQHIHTRHNTRAFSLYRALGRRPGQGVRQLSVCRDDPRLHRRLRGVMNTTELHPYQSFVEGFGGGGGSEYRPAGCSVNAAPTLACTEARGLSGGYGMFGRWTSKHHEGLVPLFKEDFQVLPGGGLALYHPRFVNKTAFVVFVLNSCPDCQDTKQMWQAYAVEAHQLVGGNGSIGDIVNTRVCTMKVQYLMFKRRDGEVVDYAGPFNVARLHELLKKTCLH